MKITKKLLAMVLSIVMLCCLAPAMVFAAPTNLDDLLGEWEGYVVYRSGTNVRNEDSHLRIYREGGEYKAYKVRYSPNAGRNISSIHELTAELDGMFALNRGVWVDSGVDADSGSLGGFLFHYDGTTLTIMTSGGDIGGRYERKSASAPASPITASVGDVIPLGGHEWRVLDVQGGRALLLSDKVLDRRQYHTASAGITWAESSVRQFLNGEFYNNTFSEAEKALIIETNIVNRNNPWFGTPGGADTRDRVFLLSIEEVVQYFGDSGALAAGPGTGTRQDSLFDEYDSARAAEIRPGADGVTFWWLRSPAHRSENAAYVHMTGAIRIGRPGNATIRVSSNGGIRPALWLTVSSSTPTPPPQPITVDPTPSRVIVNGEVIQFESYLIGVNNFFKLRDLAHVLNGTEKQFEVGWDGATSAITLTSGRPYTVNGQEMILGDGTSRQATLNADINISLDGAPVTITAYIIGVNNFMRLRDVMRLLDVFVGWDGATSTITLDTSRGYEE